MQEQLKETNRLSLKAAIEERNARQPFEEEIFRVQSSESNGILSFELLSAWLQYIRFENSCISKLKGDHRFFSTLERSIEHGFLQCEIWQQYLDYLALQKNNQRYCLVSRRCIRNVPWFSAGWVSLIDSLTRLGTTCEEIDNIYQQAFSVLPPSEGLIDVCMSAIRFYLSSILPVGKQKAETYSQKIFKQASNILMYSDENIRVTFQPSTYINVFISWIDLLAFTFEDVKNANNVMEQLLKLCPNDFQCWQECIAIEKKLSHTENIRSLYFRACKALEEQSWALEVVCQQWLRFERLYGSSDNYIRALIWNDKASKLLVSEQQSAFQINDANVTSSSSSSAQSQITSDPIETVHRHQKDNKRHSREEKKSSFDQPMATDNDRKRVRSIESKPIDEAVTIFIKQLPRHPNLEKLVFERFSSVGDIAEVRIDRDKNGRLKNFGYVCFKDSNAVDQALSLEDAKINDHTIKIERVQLKPQTGKAPSISHKKEVPFFKKSRVVFTTHNAQLPSTLVDNKKVPKDSSSSSTISSKDNPTEEPSKPLSNADFRALVFQK
jgi:RNA recognition motif-containing protein